MSETRSPVQLDDELLRLADKQARRTGRDRDEVIGDAVRRQLAADDLTDLQGTIGARSQLTFEEALELVYSERDANRRR